MKSSHARLLKPRNPLVAAARFRRAGAHARRDTSRQKEELRVRKELLALKESP
jgi:hypothetical protein